MKTKNKLITMVEIAIVLCSVFLVAIIPAIAADQNQEIQKISTSEVTTASEDDYVLGIYGNANEDDTIDMGDVVYTKLAIFGKKPKTELCDAKYDGRINVLDVIQTKLIILGKEKELTIVDSADRIVTVKKPIERVVTVSSWPIEIMRSIKAADVIVGVSSSTIKKKKFCPEFSDYPNVGLFISPDYEVIMELHPDVFFARIYGCEAIQDKLNELDPDITVICFACSTPSNHAVEIRKFGYIFDTEKEAEKAIDFFEGHMNTIKEVVSAIPEEDKPKVYFEFSGKPYYTIGSKSTSEKIAISGGKNIFSDLLEYGKVDSEDVVERNPDVIFSDMAGEGHGYDLDDLSKAKAQREQIMNRPELQNVAAVKNKRVFVISSDIFRGTSHIIGIPYLAKWFHPDLFEDLDAQAIHQEYVTRFQGVDFNVYEHGVFVYPLLPEES